MSKKKYELELLNFEGPVLKAVLTMDGFAIVDQHKTQLTVLDYERLMKFFRSELSIMDSMGRIWKYSEHSEDAKPSPEKIEEFLGRRVEPQISDDFQVGPDGAYEHSDREINFKEMLNAVSSKLKIVNYEIGDLSDLGNEIGIAIGTRIKGMTASEISQFISGFRHGVSLTNNTH